MIDYEMLEEQDRSPEDARRSPVLFRESDGPIFLDWIARGTDGNLYIAPAMPGGWLQRKRYEGPAEKLVPVSLEKSHTLTLYLYGDVGDVTIADR